MYYTFFEDIKQYLIEMGMEDEHYVKGASLEQIYEVEKTLNCPIPEAYKNWLLHFGQQMNSYYLEINLTLSGLQTATQEALKHNYSILDYCDTLFIEYGQMSDVYYILQNIKQPDSEVYCFFADDELMDGTKYFTSWIREYIITIIKLSYGLNRNGEQKRWTNDWLLYDGNQTNLDRDKYIMYTNLRKEFTEKIEEEDRKAKQFTLPEEFQYKWLDFLAEKNLTDYFLSN